ncbi:hypothetical protein D3C79_1020620 [compost metagenome]
MPLLATPVHRLADTRRHNAGFAAAQMPDAMPLPASLRHLADLQTQPVRFRRLHDHAVLILPDVAKAV